MGNARGDVTPLAPRGTVISFHLKIRTKLAIEFTKNLISFIQSLVIFETARVVLRHKIMVLGSFELIFIGKIFRSVWRLVAWNRDDCRHLAEASCTSRRSRDEAWE